MAEISVGPTYDVRLRLLPWRPKVRARHGKREWSWRSFDLVDVPFDSVSGVIAAIVLAFVAVVVVVFVLPLVLFVIEVAFVLTLGVMAVVVASFLRRSWTLVVYERGQTEPVTRFTEASFRTAWRMARTDTAPDALALPLLGLRGR